MDTPSRKCRAAAAAAAAAARDLHRLNPTAPARQCVDADAGLSRHADWVLRHDDWKIFCLGKDLR
jgi:hypothetical protein